ncbi:RNA polymerase sigma-70 factor, ECF subfamily [Thiothrix caldifontis]|uniref:RNA polymerase sigma-70 factor, ECF subfamily n=3 Tax=Thiothrix TaxID=1030 RepID=A0A1H4FA73_9GAMM|nr:RNA polymerase sigma-70 factor, ECF subfamily [Thiothrix caldifontis]
MDRGTRGTQRNMMRMAALITAHNEELERDSHKDESLDNTTRLNHFLMDMSRRAFIIARLATQDEEEALDIVQDALFKLVQKYSGHPYNEWGALFHTILHSRINDWHRRQKVRNRWRVFFFKNPEEEDVDVEDQVVQTQFLEPESQLLQNEMSVLMQTAIGQLPLRQQQALLLRGWEGYDIAETAKIMKCSEGSVKTHYSRAVHSLRKKLGDYQ